MTTKAVAVFDIDDVFFPLNEHVAKIAQVDYDKIVTYCAMDNPLLNEADRRRLYQSYQTPGMHAKMDFYPGARAFGVLARDPRLDPWLCSNSIDETVVQNKRYNLSEFLAEDYILFRQMLNIIGMENAHTKRFPDNIWLLFDDSPLNAIASQAKHVLMPRRPWNISSWGVKTLEPIRSRVQYYDGPEEACRMAAELMDKELGHVF